MPTLGSAHVAVDLNAGPDGMSLYRRLGFADHPDPTLSWTAGPRVIP
jgi:hypothetical protein